jgi:CubicO group peptidase (beta-lactamase class C family)
MPDASRPTPLHGDCDPAFASLREAMQRNFREHDEIGAAVCVELFGRRVVDLWGGYCDAARTRPWQRDTLQNAYSVGKGVTAVLVLTLVERGLLDLDAPVCDLWPEFAAEGKEEVTLRMMLAHRAGLPGVRTLLPWAAMFDWQMMTSQLASQRPFWKPGTNHGYHVNTYGFLVGELVRRRTGLPVGEALREFVTRPLGIDYHIGLAPSEHHRVADFVSPHGLPNVRDLDPKRMASVFDATGDSERDVMIRHTYFNPVGLSGEGVVNTAAWREAEIPSTNSHGTARGVAAIYSAFASGGLVGDGIRAQALSTHSEGVDLILERPSRFGLGFQLPLASRPIGPNAGSFGHFGYGGSLGFADPETGIAFGYLMNRPGKRWQTPRVQNLIDATYRAVGGSPTSAP